jgi:hypothetical protein
MRHATGRPGLSAMGAALALAACAAAPPPAAVPAAHEPSEPSLDASFDWHVLLPAPIGTLLRDMPMKLHDVLLFRGEDAAAAARGARSTGPWPPGDPDRADCHAPDGPPPRFAASIPQQYMLCFEHDRLARVEAVVRLDPVAGTASRLFERACEGWGSPAAPSSPPGVVATCEGGEGGVVWSAHLSTDETSDPSASLLDMTLAVAPDETTPGNATP